MEVIYTALAGFFILQVIGVVLTAIVDRNIPEIFVLGGLFLFFYGAINRANPFMIVGGAAMLGGQINWKAWLSIIKNRQ